MAALVILGVMSIVLSVVATWAGTTAQAQNGPPPLHARRGNSIILPGSVPPALRKAKRLGHEDSKQKLNLVIALPLSDPDGLNALLASQRDPKSTQYHQYLSTQDFINRFAPSQQSVTAVQQFLKGSGLKVGKVSANRTLVDATGTVAQAEKAFGVTIGHYKLGKRDVYGPDAPPQIPDALAPYVLNVGGLDNLSQAHPLLTQAMQAASAGRQQMPAALPQKPAPFGPTPIAGAFGPTDLRGAYDVASLISAGGSGTGQSVAVVEFAPYIANDITSYRSQYGLPSSTINPISVDSAPTTCTSGDPNCDFGEGIGEADLDIEVVSALAPNATQDVYVGYSDVDVYNQIVVAHQDPVVTTSWGACELFEGSYQMRALDQVFVEGTAQGQTFFAAAGDTGSDDCDFGNYPGITPTVDSPASDPYVLGVGGTSLTLSGGNWSAETTWNNGPITSTGGGGGGGGISSNFDQPAWQVGGGVVNSFSTGEREVPDLAADADPHTGYSVYCSSAAETKYCGGTANPWTELGGTSAATPLWAGILTDINTYLVANSKPAMGWANQTMYELLSNSQTHAPFHDITTGNNDIDMSGTPYAGDYPATACYDLTTGMGSADAWNIAQDMAGGILTGSGGSCPNTAPAQTNLVQDGGFETGAPWTQYSIQGYATILSSPEAHTGGSAFFPCAYPVCDDRVSQTITVPPSGHFTHAQLHFWLQTRSVLPAYLTTPPCVDHFYATLASTNGTVLPSGGAVLTQCENFPIFNYQYETFDVTSLLQAHYGQQLVLSFRGTTANEAAVPQFYTGWAIDDVALDVS